MTKIGLHGPHRHGKWSSRWFFGLKYGLVAPHHQQSLVLKIFLGLASESNNSSVGIKVKIGMEGSCPVGLVAKILLSDPNN